MSASPLHNHSGSAYGDLDHPQPSVGEMVRSWEQEGFIATPPQFVEQAYDETRTTELRYIQPSGSARDSDQVTTEHRGLEQLLSVLAAQTALQGASRSRSFSERLLAQRAGDMQENLTFIGEPELSEAARGIGEVWKAWLDADPKRQLCVLTEVDKLARYRGQHKSDRFVLDRILQTFSDDELARYSGRIVNDLNHIQVSPENCLAVMTDDWIVTGDSMRSTYALLMSSPIFQALVKRGRVEAHVITAGAGDISEGLALSSGETPGDRLPVRAYYQAHRARTEQAIISGAHSSVNYRFRDVTELMVPEIDRRRGKPALAYIQPKYCNGIMAIEVTQDSLRRRTPEEIKRDKAVARGRIPVQSVVRR